MTGEGEMASTAVIDFRIFCGGLLTILDELLLLSLSLISMIYSKPLEIRELTLHSESGLQHAYNDIQTVSLRRRDM